MVGVKARFSITRSPKRALWLAFSQSLSGCAIRMWNDGYGGFLTCM